MATKKQAPRSREDIMREILNRLVLKPRMKPAARESGIDPSTLFGWVNQSMTEPEKFTLEWLGYTAPFFQHCNAARMLNVAAIDHAARDLALNGHREPRFFEGRPVWRRDPKIESDALTLNDIDWQLHYGDRSRDDTFYRDPKTGALEQEYIVHPPNPALLVKLLTSLAPSVYGEKQTVEHHHSGGVWIEGADADTKQINGRAMPEIFSITPQAPGAAQRPKNSLALPKPCTTPEEFDKLFRKKLLRPVILFRDTQGKLLPPLHDDVIVAGSPQHREFQDAGIEVSAVRAETLIDDGYENDFLRELAPKHVRKVQKEQAVKNAKPAEQVAAEVAAKIGDTAARLDVILPGRASSDRSEMLTVGPHSRAYGRSVAR